MAFLDNSGDIILDAVLTDTGRFRLAKGDGSFKIAKFAFGDDEINYKLYVVIIFILLMDCPRRAILSIITNSSP